MIDLFNLFARFVPQEVLEANPISESSKLPGYDDRMAEALYQNRAYKRVIEGIDAYICSINMNYIFDKLRASTGTVLYVEPGVVTFPNRSVEDQRISVMVVAPFSRDNNDSINESIVLDDCLEKLLLIISTLYDYQHDGSLPCGATISVEGDIVPIPMEAFEQHMGWQVFLHIRRSIC